MKRGGASTSSGCATVAHALGISRYEVNQYTQVRNEPIPLYPPLNCRPLPLEKNNELMYMIDVKQEFLQRFRESPFYHLKPGPKDLKRYTDKYRLTRKENFEPQWDRLPGELNWTLAKPNYGTKKKKIDDQQVLERLGRQEQKRSTEDGEELEPQRKLDDGDEELDERRGVENENEDEEVYSDEDYQEGENDYVDNYFFDDAQAYGSDNNLDDDGY